MNEETAYQEYVEQQEKSSNVISKIQSKYIIWLVVLWIIGNTFITFGLGGEFDAKKNYYILFNIFIVIIFIVLTQTGDTKPVPRNQKEASEIAKGEGKELIEKGYFIKDDFKPGELIVTGKSRDCSDENPPHWKLGIAILDRDSKLPFYYLFKIAYYKGPIGICGISRSPGNEPYNGDATEIRYVPISLEKLQSFRKSELLEGNIGIPR